MPPVLGQRSGKLRPSGAAGGELKVEWWKKFFFFFFFKLLKKHVCFVGVFVLFIFLFLFVWCFVLVL